MGQNLIFPLNVIIIFLYISSFQDGLNDLSIPCGCLFMVDNVRGWYFEMYRKYKRKQRKTKMWQTFKTLQKTETAIFIYIYIYILVFGQFFSQFGPKLGKIEIFAKFEVPKLPEIFFLEKILVRRTPATNFAIF